MHPRSARLVLMVFWQLVILTSVAFAHPPSGIVIDAEGHAYFLYQGLVRLEPSGQLTTIQQSTGGHWLAVDANGNSSRAAQVGYTKISSGGSTLIFGDGAPLVIGADGSLYYGSNGSQEESYPTGALAVAVLPASGPARLFSPSLKQKLAEWKDGVTGLAMGTDGSLYVATWKGVLKLSPDGAIAKVWYPIAVSDCDSDPADHNPANASSPLFRGLGVDSLGDVYVAATSCHRVVKITPAGQVTTISRSERPWSPTGVAVRGEEVYVLEYTNANGPRTEGWSPRVRKRGKDGTWTTLVEFHPATGQHP